jgi:hypothetical protein
MEGSGRSTVYIKGTNQTLAQGANGYWILRKALVKSAIVRAETKRGDLQTTKEY